MTVTEESRHRLHQKLDETIGPEEATTLMEHLPPTGWIDIATKQDIERLDHRFDLVDERFKVVNDQFKVVNDQFKVVNDQLGTLGAQIAGLGTKIDSFDRRFEAQSARTEQQFWQFLGLIVAIGALVLTGIALFG